MPIDLLNQVEEADLYFPPHQLIYQAIRAFVAQHGRVDIVLLKDKLLQRDELDKVGGPAYIGALIDGVPKSTNSILYARIIKEQSLRRRLILTASSIIQKSQDAQCRLEDLFVETEEKLLSLTRNGATSATAKISLLSELMEDPALDVEQAWVLRHYIPEGCVVLLSGDPKVGKSTVAAQLAVAVAGGQRFLGQPTRRGPVLWVGLEKHPRAVVERFKQLAPHDPPAITVVTESNFSIAEHRAERRKL